MNSDFGSPQIVVLLRGKTMRCHFDPYLVQMQLGRTPPLFHCEMEYLRLRLRLRTVWQDHHIPRRHVDSDDETLLWLYQVRANHYYRSHTGQRGHQ